MKATRSVSTIASILVMLALSLVVPMVRAQATEGVILGTVRDATGAVVPGASITVTHMKTGLSREVTTNERGDYVVPHLPIGTYEIAVQHAGFRKKIVSNVELAIGEKVRVDVTLEPGELVEELTVTASIPLVKTDSPEVGQIMDERRVANLPLLGRQYLQLASLVAGANPNNANDRRNLFDGVTVVLAGSRSELNNYLIDGISNNEQFSNGFVISPSVDAIQEFKVQVSQYSAEYGRAGGGIVQIAIKSGTNEFHGTAYEFLRNDALNARRFFDRNVQPFKGNQFGFSLGGPIHRNRMFFFGNYEGNRIRQGETRLSVVPDPAQLRGDFSRAPYVIYDPATSRPDPANPNRIIRDPFPGNIIPPERISPISARIARFYPTPNRSVPGDPFNYVFEPSIATNEDQFHIRVDRRFSEKDTFFSRVSRFKGRRTDPGYFPGNITGNFWDRHGINAVLSYTRVFNPYLLNEFRLGYNFVNLQVFQSTVGQDFSTQLGIPGVPREPLNFGFPAISIRGFTGFSVVRPQGVPLPFLRKNHLYQLTNTTTYTIGAHTVKFGINIERYHQAGFFGSAGAFSASFDGRYTGPVGGQAAPNGLADFLLGFPFFMTGQMNFDATRMETTRVEAFVADDWKATPRLTVNWGLRYEGQTPFKEIYARVTGTDFRTREALIPRKAVPYIENVIGIRPINLLPFPFRIVDDETFDPGDMVNFAPRFGFAYRLIGIDRLVLRAGYGIFFGMTSGNGRNNLGVNPPWWINPNRLGHPQIPDVRLSDGLPTNLVDFLRFAFGQAIDPDFQYPYSQKFSLGLQYRVNRNFAVEASYLGNLGRKLPLLAEGNIAEPGPGPIQPRRLIPERSGITTFYSVDNSAYHGFHLEVRQEAYRGLSFMAAFTWSKVISLKSAFGDTGFGESSLVMNPRNFRLDRGLAAFDTRRRLTLNIVYDLPNPVRWRPIFGGWQISGIVALQDGFPFTIRATRDVLNNGRGYLNRADRLADGNLPASQQRPERFFDTSAFREPDLYRFGTAGQNIIIGPGFKKVDLALLKNINISEGHRLQFRAEFFNLFNNVNFAPPGFDVSNPVTFGRISSTVGEARQVQFALKYLF